MADEFIPVADITDKLGLKMREVSLDPMTPFERAIAAINNAARIENITGDQLGVLGREPLHVVTNPEEVARAVLQAIREPSEGMLEIGGSEIVTERESLTSHRLSGEVWQAMIDAVMEKG